MSYFFPQKYWRKKEILDTELGYKALRTSYTYEQTMCIYKSLCEKNGNKSLSHGFLLKNGYEALYVQMQKYGGKRKIENELGLKNLMKAYTKESVKKEYHNLCISNNNNTLKQSELTSSMNSAISRYWGGKTLLEKELNLI